MKYILCFCISVFFIDLLAQGARSSDLLSGSYSGSLNSDVLTLDIEKTTGSSYEGLMQDSYQTYVLALQMYGTKVTGTATEQTMDLNFAVSGRVQGDQLSLSFTIEVLGEKNTMDVVFVRDGVGAPQPSGLEAQGQTKLSFPSGAAHPQEMIGTWAKEEFYNSGSGDSFMGAGFTQSMAFLSDGRIAEGGSSAAMSGSYYSAQNYGAGSGIIDGIAWYTIGNTLFLRITENGQLQTIPLGTYYVEGSNMLITGGNGEKLLLSRRN